jgi:hypothetical protein
MNVNSVLNFLKKLNSIKKSDLMAKNKERLDSIVATWPSLKLRMQDLLVRSKISANDLQISSS